MGHGTESQLSIPGLGDPAGWGKKTTNTFVNQPGPLLGLPQDGVADLRCVHSK